MADEATWIADGTEEAEPVTTETPADEVAAEPVEATAETVEVDEATDTVDVEEVAAEVVQKFIDGKLGDETFQLPEGVLVPLKRGEDQTEYVPIEEVLANGMRGNDYRLKTTELAQLRRGLEREREDFTSTSARMEARAKYLDEREAEMKAALTDPESAAAYQEHLAQYESNPIYRKNVDEALLQQETAAERDALQQREDGRVVREASREVFGWLDNLKTEYPGVDSERVRAIYSRQLKSGEAALDPSALRSVFQTEQDYVDRTVSPLRNELAGIKAQLESLQASEAADQHNEKTQHAVNRARTTPVATGSGAPARAPLTPGKFKPSELAERNQEWVESV